MDGKKRNCFIFGKIDLVLITVALVLVIVGAIFFVAVSRLVGLVCFGSGRVHLAVVEVSCSGCSIVGKSADDSTSAGQ